ncbi:L,D-transpeptidase family protein [Methylophilaceae bacterium]|nr:L,D-transpeptidase family protein [Methylophilaceae bacterium]
MINFFISIIIIIALLTSNAFSLNKLTTNQKLKETEQLLVEAANKISEGEIDAALMVVENLIDINPNFKLAHMIYGDLLLIQSHNYDQVSADTHKQYKKKIYDLKLELSRRIESFNNVDKNLIGAKIKVLLAKNIEYLIFIDVKSSRLFAFSNNEGNLEYISDYYMSVGKNGYGKKYEGDKKTPIGTYFIKNKITTKLPDLYGLGAYAINFPSVYDRLNNFTGSGIWIHGTPSSTYSRPPQSSDGCIVLSNNDINELAYILNKPGIPVIISDTGLNNISDRASEDIDTSKNEILKKIKEWKKSWEEKDTEKYLEYYSNTAKYNNDNYSKWTTHKINVFKRSQDLKIKIEDISIFEYPRNDEDLILVKFKQIYSSNLLKNEMIKQQIWSKKDSIWSIIYEGGT